MYLNTLSPSSPRSGNRHSCFFETPSSNPKASARRAGGRLPVPELLLPRTRTQGCGGRRPGEPRSHCAEGADRSCQSTAGGGSSAPRRGSARPPSPCRSPGPQRQPGREACGAQASSGASSPGGRHATNQNGCPRERSPARAVRGCASAGRRGRFARRTSPRPSLPFPSRRDRVGLGSPKGSAQPEQLCARTRARPGHRSPPTSSQPAPGSTGSLFSSPVPAVRPAPPPSAPSPSRSVPIRAGCSVGSPGWCSAGAGTARQGPPPPDHSGPRGPGAAALHLLQLQPPRSPHSTAGSSSHPPAGAAAAVSGRPPSHRLLRLRGARPLSAGSPPPRPAVGACAGAREGVSGAGWGGEEGRAGRGE